MKPTSTYGPGTHPAASQALQVRHPALKRPWAPATAAITKHTESAVRAMMELLPFTKCNRIRQSAHLNV